MKLSSTACALSLCAFLLSGAVPAHAERFSVKNVPASGAQGTAFTSSLFDAGVSGLEAADIVLTFDSNVFTYSGASLGSATSGFSLVANLPPIVGSSLFQVLLSLATPLDDPVDGVSGSLVDVYFQIKPGAPLGASTLTFESSLDPLSDYEIPPTSGTVNVTQGQPGTIPEPASSMLVGMGILALAACGRRLR